MIIEATLGAGAGNHDGHREPHAVTLSGFMMKPDTAQTVIDAGKGAGVDRVGIVTEGMRRAAAQ